MAGRSAESRRHKHRCPVCGRGFSCSTLHERLEAGRFGLHTRCAGQLVFWLNPAPVRLSLGRARKPRPTAEPVKGDVAILARSLGRYGGRGALEVLAEAYRRELGAFATKELRRLRLSVKSSSQEDRDRIARLYGKELSRRGAGQWHAAAIAAIRRSGVEFHGDPAKVRVWFSRLQAREKRRKV